MRKKNEMKTIQGLCDVLRPKRESENIHFSAYFKYISKICFVTFLHT